MRNGVIEPITIIALTTMTLMMAGDGPTLANTMVGVSIVSMMLTLGFSSRIIIAVIIVVSVAAVVTYTSTFMFPMTSVTSVVFVVPFLLAISSIASAITAVVMAYLGIGDTRMLFEKWIAAGIVFISVSAISLNYLPT